MSNRSDITNHKLAGKRTAYTLRAKRIRLAQNQGPSGHSVVRNANRRIRQS